MENNSGSISHSKPVILDVITQNGGNHHNKKHKRHKQFNLKKQEIDHKNVAEEYTKFPMELKPLLIEAINYGKKTNALGAMLGAAALSKVISMIDDMNSLDEIKLYANSEMNRLKQMMSAYDL